MKISSHALDILYSFNYKFSMMEDILTSMRKQTESLDIKLENSWETEGDLYQVSVGSNINGNILHSNEETHNEIDQEQGTMQKNDFLINLEIGSKSIKNVVIRGDCQLQDIAEELAANEMIQVVYFLQEKIKKGGNNCNASEAQVLVKLRPNWKWLGIDELVEDETMTFEEVFSDKHLPSCFKPLFSLVPKANRNTDSLTSCTACSAGKSSDTCSENQGEGLITGLRDLLAKHKVSEILKKDSWPETQASQDKIMELKKHLRGLDTILNSFIPKAPKPKQHLNEDLQHIQNDHTAANCSSNIQDKNDHHSVGSEQGESYQDSSIQESFNEKCTAPLSRQRFVFDPVKEVPRLKKWFDENPSPSKRTINHYTSELNASEFRTGKIPVSEKTIYIWFKNTRARKDKIKSSRP